MAIWTNIPDVNLEPDKPILSTDVIALRENPKAIAEGAADAPRIQTAAIQDGAVTDAKLSAAVTAAGTNWVLARTAAASVGAVGTYAFLQSTNGTFVSQGQTKAGSNLAYAGLFTDDSGDTARASSSTAPAGTWRAMGRDLSQVSPARRGITLWLRIS